MNICPSCGNINLSGGEQCVACPSNSAQAEALSPLEKLKRVGISRATPYQLEHGLSSIVISTLSSHSMPIKVIGLVQAEVATALPTGSELWTTLTEVKGQRSKFTESFLHRNRAQVLFDLHLAAFNIGGDLILGTSFSSHEIGDGAKNGIIFSACGTAVKIATP